MGLLVPGQRVSGTYIVERLLGVGAFAEVYQVTHRFLGQQALKAFPLSSTTQPERLLAEARLLVDLTHANIVRVYDANVTAEVGQPLAFVTMELSPRGTLSDWVSTSTRLPLPAALEVAVQIAQGVAFTHLLDPPLIHLDIKPSNVLVFAEGPVARVKVSDYGLAATLDTETRLCSSGGTLAFAPPEMAFGIADERSDVYAIGVTLYRMATGLHPYPLVSRESLSATREFQSALTAGRRDIVPPSKLLMRKADDLDDVVMKALAFDMFSRYRNASELHAALVGLQRIYGAS